MFVVGLTLLPLASVGALAYSQHCGDACELPA
jgi:hypothetical protein